jgi:hypothetical protein
MSVPRYDLVAIMGPGGYTGLGRAGDEGTVIWQESSEV